MTFLSRTYAIINFTAYPIPIVVAARREAMTEKIVLAIVLTCCLYFLNPEKQTQKTPALGAIIAPVPTKTLNYFP
jgi:hypothetical protein